MSKCPCCSSSLLRYIRRNEVYWFCPHCWQEMPDLSAIVSARQNYRKHVRRAVAVRSASPK